jgi:aspartyl-tRNA(Asn)/glutamyl-tRNA(Gln) amidotransferase subunit B
LNYHKATLKDTDIKPEHFAALVKMVKEGKITPLKAKEMLNGFYPKSSMPEAEEKMTDKAELLKVIEKVIKDNPKAANDYKKGEKGALNFLMGEVMKATKKRADYSISKELLANALK